MSPIRRAPRRPRRAALSRFLVVFAVLVCACGASPAPRALIMRDISFPLRDLRFPSGLRVIVEEDHRAPVVGVFTLVGVGSTSDPPGKEGLAHYVEHLAFRSRPDGKTSVWNLLERAGAAMWNAGTGLDETVYWEVGPKEALPSLLLLEGVRLLAPVSNIAPEVADVEREMVRNELRQSNETGIFGSILSYAQAAVFPAGHPYARPVIGTHESLSAMTLDDAQRFVKEHYRPDDVTMVVVGDVDMATVSRVVERSLPAGLLAGSQIPGRVVSPRMAPEPTEPPPPPPAGPMARYEAALPTPELWIGWSLPRSIDAEGYLDRFAVLAASQELPRAFSHDQDIAGVGLMLVPGKQAAMLLCRVLLSEGADPDRSRERVLDQLVRIWRWDVKQRDGIVTSPTTGKRHVVEQSRGDLYAEQNVDFARLQRSAVTAMILGAESLVARGQERAELTHFSGDPTTYSRQLKAVMGVDAPRMTDFAYRYLTRERARTVLVKPLPGNATPPIEGDGARPVPIDEAPAVFDAEAIRSFVHALGVGAYRHVTLDDGLEVVIGRRAGLPVVAMGLSLHGGSATAEPPGALELMRRLGYPKVASHVTPADFGGHFAKWSDRDEFTYTFEGSAGNVGNMLDVLADWAPSMRVDPDAVAFFDREILPYLEKTERRPEVQANRAFWQTLYGPHPYGRTVAASDLGRLGAGDADRWLDTVVVPRNATLAIVGEVDPVEVEALVRSTLGKWSSATPAQAPPPPPPPAPARAPKPTILIAHRPGATQGEIRFGCLLPPPGASRARYDVMARLLSERVNGAVRFSMGASYGLGAQVVTYRGGAAHLSLTGSVDNAHVADALAVLRRTLILFEQGHFREKEIDVTRWRAARSYAVRYTTNASVVASILATRNEDRDLRAIDAYPEDLIAVTPEALAADFARCQAAPVISLVGDEPTLRQAVERAWP
jgi:zinc protease